MLFMTYFHFLNFLEFNKKIDKTFGKFSQIILPLTNMYETHLKTPSKCIFTNNTKPNTPPPPPRKKTVKNASDTFTDHTSIKVNLFENKLKRII